jgi:hypothetical protein
MADIFIGLHVGVAGLIAFCPRSSWLLQCVCSKTRITPRSGEFTVGESKDLDWPQFPVSPYAEAEKSGNDLAREMTGNHDKSELNEQSDHPDQDYASSPPSSSSSASRLNGICTNLCDDGLTIDPESSFFTGQGTMKRRDFAAGFRIEDSNRKGQPWLPG